jgi:hypothetical protein
VKKIDVGSIIILTTCIVRSILMDFLGMRIDMPRNELEFKEFKISEVNYITVRRFKGKSYSIPIYHTSHGSYAPILTLRDLSLALSPRGFRYIDGYTLINDERVNDIISDDNMIKVVFKDNSEIEISKKSRKR